MPSSEYHVVIVSPASAEQDMLTECLASDFAVHSASGGHQALDLLKHHEVVSILVDESLPDMTGLECLRHSRDAFPDIIRLMMIHPNHESDMKDHLGRGLLYEFLTKPLTPERTHIIIKRAVETYVLIRQNTELSLQFQKLLKGSLRAITDALDAKDSYTRGHAYRVTQYALAMARQMKVSEEDLQDVELGGLLHDIGKIGIPDSILLKEGKLSDEEFAVIKSHSARGHRVLSGFRSEGALKLIRHHHERFNGKGYPDSLQGDQIPLLARITAVADTYDAMTSNRPYRTALSHEEAVKEIKKNAGSQFDPEVAEVFLKLREMAGVRQIIEKAPNLPSLSPVLSAAMRMATEPEPNLTELARVLSSDTGITAKLLSLVNSAHYGLTRHIGDIRQALTIVGLRELHQVLLTATTQPLLDTAKGYSVWTHSLECAFCAETIGRRVDMDNPGEAFVVGLLHDVGKLLLQRYFPDSFQRVLSLVEKGSTFAIADAMVFTVSHAEIGAWLLETWKLPTPLCDAVRYHHKPEMSTEPLVHLAAAADGIASYSEELAMQSALDAELLDRFHVQMDEVLTIQQEAKTNAEELVKGLQLSEKKN